MRQDSVKIFEDGGSNQRSRTRILIHTSERCDGAGLFRKPLLANSVNDEHLTRQVDPKPRPDFRMEGGGPVRLEQSAAGGGIRSR